MVVLLILSVCLFGLAAALLCHYVLAKRHRRVAQSSVKTRLLGMASEKPKEQRLSNLPFLGPAIKKRHRQRLTHRAEAELPRMLDILAMGMHAGLNFDAAFGLYVNRFDSDLALLCRERFEVWERGLISRSDGLEQLAAAIDLPLFDRFCRTATRSIRYGVPMAPLIKEYADQARREYRNKQKTLVLKAPVKMLLPTGVLILPAMLLLVIGPIVMDVTGRMVSS